jgi:hypothetical protein
MTAKVYPIHRRRQTRDAGSDNGDGFHSILENLNHTSALSRTLVLPCLWNDAKLAVESPDFLRHIKRVKATMKRQAKTEGELLDHATNTLLRGIKRDMQKKDGRVNYDKLRKDGYSDRLLARLEQA